GSGPNFFYHVCPYVFSCWKDQEVFGNLIRLSWTTGNTTDLLRQLDAGVLDFVVGYGDKKEFGVKQDRLKVSFTSLGYDSKLVLGVHPAEPLWQKVGNRNLNKDYDLEKLRRSHVYDKFSGECMPRYEEDLREVELSAVDFGKSNLIIARSWIQAPGV